jgi:glycosyltransferase involved in cell wall biosynthesis
MRVSFFFRNENIGFSIEKVFTILIKEISHNNKVEITKMLTPNSMPWDVVINSYYCFKNRDKKGINHITGHIHDAILGLLGCKTVLTIHDLVFLDNVKNPIKRLYKWLFWFYLPIKLANKVTCISNQTKVNIEKRIRTNKLVVIYNPIDPTYKYVPKIFNSDKPIILHIGTGWNKNLNRSIEALKDIPCHLRIVGKISLDTINLLKENKIEFSNVFELTDDEVHKEYLNCDIISFSSLYEGFGMPIIEGQAIGRVVLTSEIEPLIEVSGGAVCFVDPIDVISIRNGFLKIIEDSNLRNVLIDKGLRNVQKFDVKKIAQEYVDLYKTI